MNSQDTELSSETQRMRVTKVSAAICLCAPSTEMCLEFTLKLLDEFQFGRNETNQSTAPMEKEYVVFLYVLQVPRRFTLKTQNRM